MGKHHILTSVHAPEQVLRIVGFAHHEDSADWCATDVKEVVDTNTMELVLFHHESRCIRYQHSSMIVERRTWGDHAEVAILTKFSSPTPQVPPQGWGDFISRSHSPQLISMGSGVFWVTGLFSLWLPLSDQTMTDRLTCFKKFICRLNRMQWKSIDSSSAGGYGLCVQWGKCWFEFHSCKGCCPPGHHSPVKLVLSHQESRCICYQYFSNEQVEKKNNHLVLTQQRPTGWTDFLSECVEKAFQHLFQWFIYSQNREFDLQELLWYEHQPFTSALSECGRAPLMSKVPTLPHHPGNLCYHLLWWTLCRCYHRWRFRMCCLINEMHIGPRIPAWTWRTSRLGMVTDINYVHFYVKFIQSSPVYWFHQSIKVFRYLWELQNHVSSLKSGRGTSETMIGCVKKLQAYIAVSRASSWYGMGLLPTHRH